MTRNFDVAVGASTVLRMNALPLGPVTFSALAFGGACATVLELSPAPNWVSDPPVTATVVANPPVQVTLAMHRNGKASVAVDFVDEADAATDVGSPLCAATGAACSLSPDNCCAPAACDTATSVCTIAAETGAPDANTSDASNDVASDVGTDGACAATTGSSCGSCGGVVQCDGQCSVATPANLGQTCGVIHCLCPISIPKVIDCSGQCVPTDSCAANCCGKLPC